MTTIPSPNHYKGRRSAIRLVVLHTMEADESNPGTAEAVGNYFSRLTTQASAHVGVDTDSECRYVDDADTAWSAPGANSDGLQLEMAGRAGQTAGQWEDTDSNAILERAAAQVATWCRTYGIPPVRLTDADLAAGARGIIDHHAATRVYRLSTHTDVGENFPWSQFLARVAHLIGGAVRPPQVTPAKPPTSRILLMVDGDFGPRTIARLQQWSGAVVDSAYGPLTRRKVQAKLHVKVDGVFGPVSTKALQRLVGTRQDGDWGPLTTKALQIYLNSIHA